METSGKSGFEKALLWWTVANVCLGLSMLLSAPLEILGAGAAAFLPLAIALPFTFWLVWRLFSPNRQILLFGSLFWALQVITITVPDGIYSFRLGLTIDFRLMDGPSYAVSVNLIAVLTALAFLVASHERLRWQENASEVP
jgi:hypothetical protein